MPGLLGGLIGALIVAISDKNSFKPATLADVVPQPVTNKIFKFLKYYKKKLIYYLKKKEDRSMSE